MENFSECRINLKKRVFRVKSFANGNFQNAHIYRALHTFSSQMERKLIPKISKVSIVYESDFHESLITVWKFVLIKFTKKKKNEREKKNSVVFIHLFVSNTFLIYLHEQKTSLARLFKTIWGVSFYFFFLSPLVREFSVCNPLVTANDESSKGLLKFSFWPPPTEGNVSHFFFH